MKTIKKLAALAVTVCLLLGLVWAVPAAAAGEDSYADIISAALGIAENSPYGASDFSDNGLFYDINGDGVMELILNFTLRDSSAPYDEDYDFYNYLPMSLVYTKAGGRPVLLLENYLRYSDEGGGQTCSLSVIAQDGATYLMTCFTAPEGGYQYTVYQLTGSALQSVLTAFEPHSLSQYNNPGRYSYQINGDTVTKARFDSWKRSFTLLAKAGLGAELLSEPGSGDRTGYTCARGLPALLQEARSLEAAGEAPAADAPDWRSLYREKIRQIQQEYRQGGRPRSRAYNIWGEGALFFSIQDIDFDGVPELYHTQCDYFEREFITSREHEEIYYIKDGQVLRGSIDSQYALGMMPSYLQVNTDPLTDRWQLAARDGSGTLCFLTRDACCFGAADYPENTCNKLSFDPSTGRLTATVLFHQAANSYEDLQQLTGYEVLDRACYYSSTPYSDGDIWEWAPNFLKADTALGTADPSDQLVLVDGVPVAFQMYALTDDNGGVTNYIKARDLAFILNGTAAQFEVGWYGGTVFFNAGWSYTPNGSEMSTPFSGSRPYSIPTGGTAVNGVLQELQAIYLTDDAGGGYTYYKLRDLGQALGFAVDWSADAGISVRTSPAN